jgi:aminoglycoside phosphotransferase (APT) family kinase protein
VVVSGGGSVTGASYGPDDAAFGAPDGPGYRALTMRGIDEERVGAWLEANVEGVTAPITFELIAGGHSNLTFKATDANGRRLVVRRPPLGHVLATAHDMGREHRIISAVWPTPVPVAPTYGLCEDEEVNGAPFYVMGYVDGVVLDSPEKASLLSPERRQDAGYHLVDVLAALHSVDVDAVGLGDLARRDGYIERQLRRWSKQWEASKTRELPAIEEVQRRLEAHVPEQHGVSIVHGDYRFGNCLLDPEAGRVTAVLDWELCTLGDPLADVGYLFVYWADSEHPPKRSSDPTAAGGFPSRGEVIERYAAATGRDLSGIAFYEAFSSWRLAVISEGVYARYVKGVMADESADVDSFKAGVEQLAESALAAARSLG